MHLNFLVFILTVSLEFICFWRGYFSLEKVLGYFSSKKKVFVQVSSDFKTGFVLSELCLVVFLALY